MILFFRNNDLSLPFIFIGFENAIDLFDDFGYVFYPFVILSREGPKENGSLLEI